MEEVVLASYLVWAAFLKIKIFSYIFRGALDVRASVINEEMKVATSRALASLISEEDLNEENIIPSALDKNVGKVVAAAVAEAARATGVARI